MGPRDASASKNFFSTMKLKICKQFKLHFLLKRRRMLRFLFSQSHRMRSHFKVNHPTNANLLLVLDINPPNFVKAASCQMRETSLSVESLSVTIVGGRRRPTLCVGLFSFSLCPNIKLIQPHSKKLFINISFFFSQRGR